jgi:hypothetical protein
MSTAAPRRAHNRTSAVDDDVILTGGRRAPPGLACRPSPSSPRPAATIAAIAAGGCLTAPSDCADDPNHNAGTPATTSNLVQPRLDIEVTLKEK